MILDLWSLAIIISDLIDLVIYIFEEGFQFSTSFFLVSIALLVIGYFAWRSTEIDNDIPPPPNPPYVLQVQGINPSPFIFGSGSPITINNNNIGLFTRGRNELSPNGNLTDIRIVSTGNFLERLEQRRASLNQTFNSINNPTSTSSTLLNNNSPINVSSSTSASSVRSTNNRITINTSGSEGGTGTAGTGGIFSNFIRRTTHHHSIHPIRHFVRSRLNTSPSLIVYHRVNVYHHHTNRVLNNTSTTNSGNSTAAATSRVPIPSTSATHSQSTSQVSQSTEEILSNSNSSTPNSNSTQASAGSSTSSGFNVNVVNVDVNVDVEIENSDNLNPEDLIEVDETEENLQTQQSGSSRHYHHIVSSSSSSGNRGINEEEEGDNNIVFQENLNLNLNLSSTSSSTSNSNQQQQTQSQPVIMTNTSATNDSIQQSSSTRESSSQSQKNSQDQQQQQQKDNPQNSPPEDDVRITLKFLNDTQMEVITQLSEKVVDFKRRHFTTELNENKTVRLIFNGRVLDNDLKTLREAGIFDQCVVHCLIVTPQTSQSGAQIPVTGSTGDRARVRNGRGPEPGLFFVSIMGIILVFLWFCCFSFGTVLFTQSAVVSLTVLTAIFLIGLVAFYLPIHPNN